jgi:hypothetical protein
MTLPRILDPARIIEMALLNSTHVIALITTNTAGSKWVPYEYGRAKDSSMYSLKAGCWIASNVPRVDIGDYLRLGVMTSDDPGITQWLTSELTAWNRQFGTCGSGPTKEDAIHPPAARPAEADLDAIEKAIMNGLSRPIVVRGPLQLKKPLGATAATDR